MTTLPAIPRRGVVDVVLIERRGGGWLTGIGPVAFGHITRGIESHPTEEAAERAAIELADRLDLMAMRA